MTDRLVHLPRGTRDERALTQTLCCGEDGAGVGGEGAVDEDPVRYSAGGGEGGGGAEMRFPLDVGGGWEGGAPVGGGVEPG
ncbi:hypothetical protein V500_08895 [Pseudogymnoascus sp. VKM F-4518 (FW-2643)]|nr:hypothetical protein V500_08895 [Pseudogymnoascus sp. VKM F-4518 (FW-2643)]